MKEARNKREAAKKLLEQNIDPSQSKQSDRRKAIAESKADTFEGVTHEFISKKKEKWSESYSGGIKIILNYESLILAKVK